MFYSHLWLKLLNLTFTTVIAGINPEHAETPTYAYRNDWQSDLVHDYDVTFYFLDIAVSSTSIQVGGTVEIHATVVADDFDVLLLSLRLTFAGQHHV